MTTSQVKSKTHHRKMLAQTSCKPTAFTFHYSIRGSSRIVIIFTSVRWEGGGGRGSSVSVRYLNVVYDALRFLEGSQKSTFSKYSYSSEVGGGGGVTQKEYSYSSEVGGGGGGGHTKRVLCALLIMLTILDDTLTMFMFYAIYGCRAVCRCMVETAICL